MQKIESGTLTSPPFIADPLSVQRTLGAQIDFDLTDAARAVSGKKSIKGGTVMSRLSSGKIVPRADFNRTVSVAVSAGVATATTTAPHDLETGQFVTIEGVSSSVDGRHEVTKTSATEFTFPATGSGGSGGALNLPATEVLISGATEDEPQAALSGYGTLRGAMLFENLLPDAVAGKLPEAIKAELDESRTFFSYVTYRDSRLV